LELIRKVKMKALKELARRIWHWLFTPPKEKTTYTCCSNADKDGEEE